MTDTPTTEHLSDDGARRLFYGRCVHCGCGSDQFGYAHADRCPCRSKADLAGEDKTL